jgi:hypothetical protein
VTDEELIRALGIGLSYPEPKNPDWQLADDDVGSLGLLSNHLPDMTAGELIFKFGNSDLFKLASKYQSAIEGHTKPVLDTVPPTSVQSIDPSIAASTDAAAAPANKPVEASPTPLLMPPELFDRHRVFSGLIFETTREFGNFWGEDPFPYYIRDDKLVFETAKQADEYYRRAWRFLSENILPELTPDLAKTTTRSTYFRKVTHLFISGSYLLPSSSLG